MLVLRSYQRAAIDSLYEYWRDHPTGSPLIVLPTGAGKSLVIGTGIVEFLEIDPQTRIVNVTHVKELIEQNFQEFMGISPWAPAGIYSASLGRREAHAQVMFAGIQTVYNKADRIGHVDVLKIDEAHLVPPDAAGMYRTFINALRAINPSLIVVGYTATPFRLDSGRLDDGDDRLFDAITYEISIRDLIEAGFLCPLISKATSTVLSTKGVKTSGGDFNAKALEAAVDKHPITAAAVDEMIHYGNDPDAPRAGWLAFCAGVEHAHHVADELRRRGIPAEAIDGAMKKTDRARIIGLFKERKLRALTNANVLTTGFNAPHVDMLAMLRATKSASLYIQMVGRVARCIGKDIAASIANGKADGLVLDFAGNVRRHGPVDAVDVKEPGKGGGEAPIKECPTCHSLILAAARECPDCGHIFERDVEKNIAASAGSAPIISKMAPKFVPVQARTFRRHDKPFGTPSVRVDYLCGAATHKEWICPEHEGGARNRFEKWWKTHGGAEPFPSTVDETLTRAGSKELREVEEIRIRPNGPYWEICGHKLAAPALPWRKETTLEIAQAITLPDGSSSFDIAEAFARLRSKGGRGATA